MSISCLQKERTSSILVLTEATEYTDKSLLFTPREGFERAFFRDSFISGMLIGRKNTASSFDNRGVMLGSEEDTMGSLEARGARIDSSDPS